MRLLVSDACMGVIESLGESYADGLWQRCAAHFYRNVFSVAPLDASALRPEVLRRIRVGLHPPAGALSKVLCDELA